MSSCSALAIAALIAAYASRKAIVDESSVRTRRHRSPRRLTTKPTPRTPKPRRSNPGEAATSACARTRSSVPDTGG